MYRIPARSFGYRPRLNQQLRTNTTNTATNLRLASEFNGLLIPSQQEQLSSQKNAAADRRRHGSIEQRRRARSARDTHQRPRYDHTADERRRAWVAREAEQGPTTERRPEANNERQPGRDPVIEPRWRAHPTREASMANGEQHPGNRRRGPTGTGVNREWSGLDGLGQLKPRVNTFGAKPRGRRDAEQGYPTSDAPRKGDGRRSHNSRSTRAKRSKKSEDATLDPQNDADIIQEGGEEVHGPKITAPEGFSVNLADVFQPKQLSPGLVLADSTAPTLTGIQTRKILETVGGDYTRYLPQPASAYLTGPEGMDILMQAQLAVSKNRAIDANQREYLLRIVGASAAREKMV